MDINSAKQLVLKAGLKLGETGLIVRTWGNVSCRIDDRSFAVTPSGRSYHSLTSAEIVTVNISDCSCSGDIKPSSEKGIHAEVYKLFPEINFIIHTHQENASIISASVLESIKTNNDHSCLGSEVICAAYALPGTEELKDNVIDALKRSDGKAVIMKNHGALCLGRDFDEAFMVAAELESFCYDLVVKQYLKISGKSMFDSSEMNQFSLSLNNKTDYVYNPQSYKSYCDSIRSKNGFYLYSDDNSRLEVLFDSIDPALPGEAETYNALYKKYNKINNIIFKNTPEIDAISRCGLELRPMLDDFAQIAGTLVRNVGNNPDEILKSLKKASAVFLRSGGALCFGKTEEDAIAVGMVVQKGCKAYIAASLFGEVIPIDPVECRLMHYNYVNKYSKQA